MFLFLFFLRINREELERSIGNFSKKHILTAPRWYVICFLKAQTVSKSRCGFSCISEKTLDFFIN